MYSFCVEPVGGTERKREEDEAAGAMWKILRPNPGTTRPRASTHKHPFNCVRMCMYVCIYGTLDMQYAPQKSIKRLVWLFTVNRFALQKESRHGWR